jgi:hypothetical protein
MFKCVENNTHLQNGVSADVLSIGRAIRRCHHCVCNMFCNMCCHRNSGNDVDWFFEDLRMDRCNIIKSVNKHKTHKYPGIQNNLYNEWYNLQIPPPIRVLCRFGRDGASANSIRTATIHQSQWRECCHFCWLRFISITLLVAYTRGMHWVIIYRILFQAVILFTLRILSIQLTVIVNHIKRVYTNRNAHTTHTRDGIHVDGICMNYRQRCIVNKLSFHVGRGEVKY